MSKAAIRIALVCAGKYHDIDFARLKLLRLLSEHEHVRVDVYPSYAIPDLAEQYSGLITYTCDVVAKDAELSALRDWLHAGGRWFALHGTNSVLEFVSTRPLKIDTPDSAPGFMSLLGTQFQAHPPIGEFAVKVARPDDPLVAGVEAFTTSDEKYLCKVAAGVETLLYCEHDQPVDDFQQSEWRDTQQQPVLYRHRQEQGEVVYLTLGHCRGHYDMQPLMDFYPRVERGSWETLEFYTLLRNGINWTIGDI